MMGDAASIQELLGDLAEQVDGRPMEGAVSDEEEQLVLYHTLLCNATCAHCMVESGPEQHGTLPIAQSRLAIDGASETGMPLVVFTGGESLIYLRDVLDLCRHAKQRGLRTRVVTNGYWARSPRQATEMLDRLVSGGVDEIFVSFDEYHVPFIEPERVRNIMLGVATSRVIPYLVFSTVIRDPSTAQQPVRSESGITWPRAVIEILETYEFPVEACVPQVLAHAALQKLEGAEREQFKESMIREHALIAWQTLGQGGRASRELAGSIESRSLDEDAGEPCAVAGRLLTVPTHGRVYPCCSVWSNFEEHHFGEFASAADLAERRRTMQQDAVVRFIHEQGPGELLRRLRARGHDLPARYTDICNMCEHLFNRFSLEELRNELASELRERQSAGTP